MTTTDWTFGTDADQTPAEPFERVDARCTCGWRSHPTSADRANRLAREHRQRWANAAERNIVKPLDHHTTVGPVELDGDHLAATAETTPEPPPFGRRYRIALAHLILRAAALLIVTVVDRRATVETSVSTYTVERLEAGRG